METSIHSFEIICSPFQDPLLRNKVPNLAIFLEVKNNPNLEGLKDSSLRRLFLSNINSVNFPIIQSDTLEELVISKSNIANLDYNLQEKLPILRKLFLDCNLTDPPYFEGWDIDIHNTVDVIYTTTSN